MFVCCEWTWQGNRLSVLSHRSFRRRSSSGALFSFSRFSYFVSLFVYLSVLLIFFVQSLLFEPNRFLVFWAHTEINTLAAHISSDSVGILLRDIVDKSAALSTIFGCVATFGPVSRLRTQQPPILCCFRPFFHLISIDSGSAIANESQNNTISIGMGLKWWTSRSHHFRYSLYLIISFEFRAQPI